MACFLVDDGLVDPARLRVLDPSGDWIVGIDGGLTIAHLVVGPVARNLAGARKAKRIRRCVAAQRAACTDIPHRQEHQWTTPRTATTTS